MDSSLQHRHATVVSQPFAQEHERLLTSHLNVRALLLVARHRSGPARIVSCYPPVPDDDESTDRLDEAGYQTEEDDDDETASSIALTSAGLTSTRTSNDADADKLSATESTINEAIAQAAKTNETLVSSPRASNNTQPASERPSSRDVWNQEHLDTSSNDVDKLFGMQKESLARLLAPSSAGTWHLT